MGFLNKLFGNGDLEYYAVIDRAGGFYSGDIPDVKMCKVSLCNSYNEVINRLCEKLKDQQEKSVTWHMQLPAKTPFSEIAAKYPGKQIIPITPNGAGKHPDHKICPYDNDSYEYYAYIEKNGSTYSGKMPDIVSGEITDCKTFEAAVEKLTEKLTTEYENAGKTIAKMPYRTSYNQMIAHNPGKQVVSIRPSRF